MAPPVVSTPAAPAAPVSGGAATTGGDAPDPTPRPAAPAGVSVQPAPPRRPGGPTTAPIPRTPYIAFGYTPANDAYSDITEARYRALWGPFTGNNPAVRNFYLDLDNNGDFPAGQLNNVYTAGMTPMLSFNTGTRQSLLALSNPATMINTYRETPNYTGRYAVQESVHAFFTRWVEGDPANRDHYPGARKWARDTGRRVLIRLNWEFNIEWAAWSVPTPAAYNWRNTVEHWKAVWNMVRGYFADVPNVEFVWCPNAEERNAAGAVTSTPVEQFYVPLANADWWGMDGYSFGPWQRSGNPYRFPWRSFDTIFKQTHDKLAAQYPGKRG